MRKCWLRSLWRLRWTSRRSHGRHRRGDRIAQESRRLGRGGSAPRWPWQTWLRTHRAKALVTALCFCAKGSGIALAIGLIGSVLAGLGITGATQKAFNQVWYIPRKLRPNFVTWRLRGLGLLVLLGLLMILSSAAAGFVTAQTVGVVELLAGILLALAVNLLLFFFAFRLLTSDEIATRDLIPGIVVAAVLWQILQHVGSYYVDHVVRHAKETSGLFAFVLGLLAWIYLGAQTTLVAAEVNVVRARRLWPRSFYGDPLLDADKRALTAAAEVEQRIDEQSVEVSFNARE